VTRRHSRAFKAAGVKTLIMYLTSGPVTFPVGLPEAPSDHSRLPSWCSRCSLGSIMGQVLALDNRKRVRASGSIHLRTPTKAGPSGRSGTRIRTALQQGATRGASRPKRSQHLWSQATQAMSAGPATSEGWACQGLLLLGALPPASDELISLARPAPRPIHLAIGVLGVWTGDHGVVEAGEVDDTE